MTHPKGLCIHVLTVLLLFMPVHASGRFFVFNYGIKPNAAKPFSARVEITCPDPVDQPQELPDSSASTSTGTIQITTILTNESEQNDTASSPAGNEIRMIQYSLQPLNQRQKQNSVATHDLLNHDGELIQQVALDPFTLQLLEGIETSLTPAQFQQAASGEKQPFFLAFLPALPDESFQTQYPVYRAPEPPGSDDEEYLMALALQAFHDVQQTAFIHYEDFSDYLLIATAIEHVETNTHQPLLTMTLTECGELTDEASDTETSETLLTDNRYASGDSQDSSTSSLLNIYLSNLVATLGLILAETQLNLITKKPLSSSYFRDRSSSF